jgi:CCR4-NOT complex subunit CAF16
MVEALPHPPPQSAAAAGGDGTSPATNDASAVRVEHLSFTYPLSADPTVRDLSLELPPGSRCLLIGANGAGEWGR